MDAIEAFYQIRFAEQDAIQIRIDEIKSQVSTEQRGGRDIKKMQELNRQKKILQDALRQHIIDTNLQADRLEDEDAERRARYEEEVA